MIVEDFSQLLYKLDTLNEAKVGRELPHIEDRLINSTDDAINSLQELKSQLNQASIKWDGQSAIYFGHDKNGNFYLVPKSQWLRGQLQNKEQLAQDIMSTGRKRPEQSEQEFLNSRKQLANTYMTLWDSLESASKNTTGFFKGDLMFDERQKPDKDGNYRFTPSKVTYTVNPKGLYGKMPTANAFVTVHGKAKKLGSEESVPVNQKDISNLNSTPYVIALGPQVSSNVKINTANVDKMLGYLQKNKASLDKITNFSIPKFTTIRSVLYDYSVKNSKSGGTLSFDEYLQQKPLSANMQNAIKQLAATKEWKTFWDTYFAIRKLNHDTLDQLNKQHAAPLSQQLGISANIGDKPGGEGYVLPSGKLVNPHWRSAPMNPRFGG
jgi:hypothetical protein